MFALATLLECCTRLESALTDELEMVLYLSSQTVLQNNSLVSTSMQVKQSEIERPGSCLTLGCVIQEWSFVTAGDVCQFSHYLHIFYRTVISHKFFCTNTILMVVSSAVLLFYTFIGWRSCTNLAYFLTVCFIHDCFIHD